MTGRVDQVFPRGDRFAAPQPVISREKLIVSAGRAAAAVLLCSGALVACTSSAPAARSSSPPTSTRTVVVTRTATTTARPYDPPPPSTVAPLAPGARPPRGEHAGRCPYIRAGLDVEPGPPPTVADIEGDRVGRSTLLTSYRPVGCRFYFAYPPHEPVADILPTRFGTAVRARNAMVRTAAAGTDAQTYPNFAPGLTGISYRTTFYGADGARDWAFVFATGAIMVVVHTQQTRSSSNARYLAAAIAAKF
jgi:hypothetical protein